MQGTRKGFRGAKIPLKLGGSPRHPSVLFGEVEVFPPVFRSEVVSAVADVVGRAVLALEPLERAARTFPRTEFRRRAGPPSLLRHLRPPPSSPWLQWDARRVSMVPSLIPAPPDGDQPQGTRTLSHIPPQSARGRRKKTCFYGVFRGLSPPDCV